MKRSLLIAAIAAVVLSVSVAQRVSAFEGAFGGMHSYYRVQPQWHGGYYHSAWGTPVALVVLPTARCQTDLSWGVGGSRVTRIRPQFQRNYPGPGQYDRSGFRPTPPWPSDTRQFGVYYIRGPR